eukprot:8996954-Pyramimonas_sp.AAC.2
MMTCVGSSTQGEKKGRVSGDLCAPLPLLAQEDPQNQTKRCYLTTTCVERRLAIHPSSVA